MNSTKYWICDKCGKEIKSEDGWLEWKKTGEGDKGREYGFRIVHRIDCIYNQHKVYREENAIISDSDLEYFMGPDGLMRLLELLSLEEVESEELLEIIKRIHIPGYEEARPYFNEAIHGYVFEPNTKPMYYSQNNIKAVIDYKRNLYDK